MRVILAAVMLVCSGCNKGPEPLLGVGELARLSRSVSDASAIPTDGPNWYRQFQKYPWEDPMEYAVRSPLHYVANVTTPTLVMTGELDTWSGPDQHRFGPGDRVGVAWLRGTCGRCRPAAAGRPPGRR